MKITCEVWYEEYSDGFNDIFIFIPEFNIQITPAFIKWVNGTEEFDYSRVDAAIFKNRPSEERNNYEHQYIYLGRL